MSCILRGLTAAAIAVSLGLAGCEQERKIIDVETPEGGLEIRETDEGLEIETEEKGD